MSLSEETLQALNKHWAVATFDADELSHVNRLVHQHLAQQAVGEQIRFSFEEEEGDESLLNRVAMAFELAAIEGLDELISPTGENQALHNQAMAASFRTFEFLRLFPVPTEMLSRLFFVLKLSAVAYCGDRWPDLKRWYREHKTALNVPSVVDAEWDQRLLYRLFECWVRLFRKEGWDDLDRIREIIAGLRSDQRVYEERFLQNGSGMGKRASACRLVALYNWARGTEIIAGYMLQGEPGEPSGLLDKHFEAGIRAVAASGDMQHEMVLRWLHAAVRIMVKGSLWWAARSVNSHTSKFVNSLARREHQAMFELLPPQRAALLEQGLLDQAKTAIVVDMPTSGGKTLLAQFRILQALNQFQSDHGWVAYVAPTRALSAQITRRLRTDFEPIGLDVEQLTAAVEVDAFEEELLTGNKGSFHVLVATPEKLSLVIRNRKVSRPLALVVMDEAHNLESENRGLRIELLLATIKHDCPKANFLLLMPYVENVKSIARWLAQDTSAGNAISLGTIPWKPNERIIGLFRAVVDDSKRAGWHLEFETLTTTEKAMPLHGTHRVGGVRPLNVPKSKVITGDRQEGLGLQTVAISSVMSARGTSIAVANRIPTTWTMAREAAKILPEMEEVPSDIRLVQSFLRTEISEDFPLINLLAKGIGVHHAGLSDEVRALVEWLAEAGHLRILCATTTIAQGLNFPVSSVFLQTRNYPYEKKMSTREFWNLAGRAGRLDHDSVGVVGLCEANDREANIEFVHQNTGALVSRLVKLMDDLAGQGKLANLSEVLREDKWEDFRCYIAHLWAEKRNLEAVLADSEQLLRQTYGYISMQKEKADALLDATRKYAHRLSNMPEGVAGLADSTGFSPEGVRAAMDGITNLENKLTVSDWVPESLFGDDGRMSDLFGVLLKIPQLRQDFANLIKGGGDQRRISDITSDWVNGKSLKAIAEEYFSGKNNDEADITDALTNACKAIYRTIVNSGTWGISALSRMSGLDFDALSDADKRQINVLPAMIYHGVKTEGAVLMRMNSAPRSAAEALGNLYRESCQGDESQYSVREARQFLRGLDDNDWEKVRPEEATLTGTEYKKVWKILSGEAS